MLAIKYCNRRSHPLPYGRHKCRPYKPVTKPNLTHTDIEEFTKQGVKGIICDFISYNSLKQLLGKDIGVAITGNEEIPFSLLILCGFADSPNTEYLTDFSVYEDKYVLLLPSTQIRAGVVRPRVLIFEVNE